MFKLFFILMSIPFAIAAIPEPSTAELRFQQAPPHLEWMSFETEHFKFIYPKEVGPKVEGLSQYLEAVYPLVGEGLNSYPQKIPLILQTEITSSNAFVTLMPRRSEWVMRPYLQSPLNSVDWLQTLSLHEYRHVVQFNKSNQGFNKYFYYFLGEAGQALGLALTFPNWFLEGDAVGVETLYSLGGRGRQPYFERELKAILLNQQKFSFDQAYLGSFKSYLPNHYVYGYFLTTWMKNKYGEQVFDRIGDSAAESSYNPLTFYRRVEEFVGKDFETFYTEVMKDLKSHWESQPTDEDPLDELHHTDLKTWTNFSSPQILSSGDIVAFKSGLGDILQLVKISSKKEKIIYYPTGITEKIPLRLRNDKVAFLEYIVAPRFMNSDHQRVVVCDFKNEECDYPLSQTMGKIVALSPNAEKFALVELDREMKQEIKIYSLKGELEQSFEYSPLITSLDWFSPQELLLVERDHETKRISLVNLKQSSPTTLLEAKAEQNLGDVFQTQGRVLFESNKSGIDEIYELKEGRVLQLTSSRFGSYHPSLTAQGLVFNRYSLTGMKIVKSEVSEKKSETTFKPFYQLPETPKDQIVKEFAQTKENHYPAKAKDHFNFHSWQILIPPLAPSLTLSLQSTDLLAQHQFALGYERNLNEHTNSFFMNYAFQKYDPIFDLTLQTRARSVEYSNNTSERWNESIAGLGLTILRQKLWGRYQSQFKLSPRVHFISIKNRETKTRRDLGNTDAFNPKLQLNYSLLSKMALKDLYPEKGLALEWAAETLEKGSHTSLKNLFYLPGLFKHHSFFQEASYEKQNPRDYEFLSNILFSRGYSYKFSPEQTKLSSNYSLPIAYPEFSLGPYAYLKRLSVNGFYDYMKLSPQDLYRSYGGELMFETHFFRLPFLIKFGLRLSFLVDDAVVKNDTAIFLAPTTFQF